MDKLYIVIPAYNEQDGIESVVVQWHEVVSKIGPDSRLVVFDDSSGDGTYEKLEELKKNFPQLRAVRKENSGYGGTVLYGYRYALKKGADYVFQTDSDGQAAAGDFWPFWENRKSYDIQIGYRKPRQDGLSRIVVTKVLKLVLFFSFGLWLKDANAPFRLMEAKSLAEHITYIPEDYNLSNVLLTVLYEKGKKRIGYHRITFWPGQGRLSSVNLRKMFKIGKKAVRDFRALRKQYKIQENLYQLKENE